MPLAADSPGTWATIRRARRMLRPGVLWTSVRALAGVAYESIGGRCRPAAESRSGMDQPAAYRPFAEAFTGAPPYRPCCGRRA